MGMCLMRMCSLIGGRKKNKHIAQQAHTVTNIIYPGKVGEICRSKQGGVISFNLTVYWKPFNQRIIKYIQS